MSEWVLSEPNQKDVCDTPLKSLYKRPIGYDLILYAREKQRERAQKNLQQIQHGSLSDCELSRNMWTKPKAWSWIEVMELWAQGGGIPGLITTKDHCREIALNKQGLKASSTQQSSPIVSEEGQSCGLLERTYKSHCGWFLLRKSWARLLNTRTYLGALTK